MKNTVKHLIFAVSLVLMLPLVLFSADAAENNLASVQYYVTYNQPDARSMLKILNSFRTGDEAWYWNSDDKTKTYCENLEPLTYDYELEKIAMQRAAEIAISFSHTRPNGESCFSLYPDSYIYCGENIAVGYSTVSSAMEGWKETDLPYSGQGHRRNMLSENYNAVGIAKVYFGGTYYWVQEFGYTENTTEKTTAVNYSKRVEAEVDFTGADYTVELSPKTMKLRCGVLKAWPTVSINFRLPSAWSSVYTEATVLTELTEAQGKRIIFTGENGICAMGEGDSKLVAEVLGKTYEVKVQCDHSYYDTYVVYETCTTEGSVIVACPCGAKYDRSPPPLGHNYEKIVQNATFKKDGYVKNVCRRCDDVTEEVIPAVGETTLSLAEYTYNGKALKPTVTVKDTSGTALKEGTDYTVKYASGRKLPGKYGVTVILQGDYAGKKTLYFRVLPKKTAKVTAECTDSEIKLSWKKSEGATGYRVFLYDYETGKYKALKTLTATTYTVKKLKSGTKYKFAVKTYTKTDDETLWSESSKTVTAYTKLATPTVKITAGTKKATLKWSKITNADGYQVYMKTADGYKKIKVTDKTSYTKTGLQRGKSYSFRVRAYSKTDGKYVYSSYKTYKVTV